MTPEEEEQNRKNLEEMEKFLDELDRSNTNKEPFDAVEAVREGRSRF
jgi:hypothetical protein